MLRPLFADRPFVTLSVVALVVGVGASCSPNGESQNPAPLSADEITAPQRPLIRLGEPPAPPVEEGPEPLLPAVADQLPPKTWVQDETHFFTADQEAALLEKIELIRQGFSIQMAVIARPGAIGETVHSDASKKVRAWFSSQGKAGGVFLIHRGTQEAALVTNIHLHTPADLDDIRQIYLDAAQDALRDRDRPYEVITFEAALLVLDGLHRLLDENL
jgi:hypothetical protein